MARGVLARPALAVIVTERAAEGTITKIRYRAKIEVGQKLYRFCIVPKRKAAC